MLAAGRDASTIRNAIVLLRTIYRDADVLVPGGVAVNPTVGLGCPPSADGATESPLRARPAS